MTRSIRLLATAMILAVAASPQGSVSANDVYAPFVIAHAAGNDPSAIDSELVRASDVVEIDVVYASDELLAAHSTWELAFAGIATERPSVSLGSAWEAIPAGLAIELDIKSTSTEAIRLLVLFLRDRGGETTVLVSSRDPRVMRALRLHVPEVCRYLSIGSRSALTDLLAETAPASLFDGVMVSHRLLDQETIAALHAAGLTVVAWTVNDPERAAELAAWGVDGLTTDSASIAGRHAGNVAAPSCARAA